MKLALFLICVYVIYGAVMVWLHPRFIYPFLSDDEPMAGFERVSLTAGDGVEISLQVASGDGPVVLYFMGNAGTISLFEPGLRPLVDAGMHVVALEYRGGAGRPGRPSEEVLKEDALLAADYALGLDKPVLVHGFSMGSGLAMHVGANRDVAGLVLEAPYSKMCRLMAARSLLPACVIPFVQKWDNLALAPQVKAPVLILHGSADVLIPPSQSVDLASGLREAQRVIVEGAEHTNTGTDPRARRIISEFFEEVVQSSQ